MTVPVSESAINLVAAALLPLRSEDEAGHAVEPLQSPLGFLVFVFFNFGVFY